jgi:hypothetical protein
MVKTADVAGYYLRILTRTGRGNVDGMSRMHVWCQWIAGQ